MGTKKNRYSQIIERIFFERYKAGNSEIPFEREDFTRVAKELRIKLPQMLCRPVAAQFLGDNLIALFELENTKKGIAVSLEKHYKLVPPEEMTAEDLESYKKRTRE